MDDWDETIQTKSGQKLSRRDFVENSYFILKISLNDSDILRIERVLLVDYDCYFGDLSLLIQMAFGLENEVPASFYTVDRNLVIVENSQLSKRMKEQNQLPQKKNESDADYEFRKKQKIATFRSGLLMKMINNPQDFIYSYKKIKLTIHQISLQEMKNYSFRLPKMRLRVPMAIQTLGPDLIEDFPVSEMEKIVKEMLTKPIKTALYNPELNIRENFHYPTTHSLNVAFRRIWQ